MINKVIWPSIFLSALTGFAVGQDAHEPTDSEFWNSVYSANHVLDIRISLTSADWKTMEPKNQGRRRPGGPPGPRRGGRPGPGRGGPSTDYTYVKSKIAVDGQVFEDAGLRFKGNSSYRFSSGGMKRPMKIDMNRFNKGQKLHGRDKLNLSNSALDSAFMKEKLAYGLYASAGLATPGVGWANVTLTIDGEETPLGVYVIIEQVDKQFLEGNFGEETKDSLLMKPEVSQWMYLGEDPDAYSEYEIKNGKQNVDQIKRFAELLKLIQDAPKEVFEKEIADRMDLPQLAGYLAATSLLSSLDSYSGAPHNYYLLLDRTDGMLRILPWDVNEAFGTFNRGSSVEQLVDWDIDRPWVANRPLLERLFATESFPKLYRSAVQKLSAEFTEDKLFPLIAEYQSVLAPHVGKYKAGAGIAGLKMGIDGDRTGFNLAVERRILAIKPFITQRSQSVKTQLSGEREGQTLRNRRR